MSSRSFPPLVDLRATGWPPARVEIAEAIASVNNEIVERAAHDRLDVGDHIYSFAKWCELSGGPPQ